ncbi:D-aspartate oxidase [Blattella germanica]|nr:D-aspartate oxidase [Blattella germanica]
MPPRIAVIGAGVIGMSTAVLAQEKIPGIDITVISEKFTPHTTGDVSAGLWFPYCLKDTSPSDIRGGVHFMTFTLEPSRYLPYLTKKFQLHGGKIQQLKVERLEDLCGQFDVVINCSGIQAHQLVNDRLVAPVKAPWMFTILGEHADDGNYIIPNMDAVILGGTHQQDDWNTNPDPKDSKAILEGCSRLIPGLRVIHNYGHGGSGVTLSWGCAHDAVKILQDILNSSLPTNIYKSKL